MKNIILCGHTGSKNRGCDAIIRSTTKVLKESGVDNVAAMTFDEQYDSYLGLDNLVELISYPKKPKYMKILSLLRRVIFHDGVWGNYYYNREIFRKSDSDTLLFNVGGDVYCYGVPELSYALNKKAYASGIPNILWCCSLDEKIVPDKAMIEDLNRYTYIIARESMTYEMISNLLTDKNKLHIACDPAFLLPVEETEFPDGFLENQTIGINLSHLVMNDLMYENVVCLIDYILRETGMNVCLIPHVYENDKTKQDLKVLGQIYDLYRDNSRVSMVDKELTSTQLKYLISHCRFFIGARTHSMIAAYSSCVPALALSYSMKSRGIAKDLFGSCENYAISKNDLIDKNTLLNIFVEEFLQKENEIKERYYSVMQEYKKSLPEVCKKILKYKE